MSKVETGLLPMCYFNNSTFHNDNEVQRLLNIPLMVATSLPLQQGLAEVLSVSEAFPKTNITKD